jgi:DNA polymerase-4
MPQNTAMSDSPSNLRRIAHLDMDAFYASVELLKYPELHGQAVVVGGRRDSAPRTDAAGVRHFSHLRDYVGRGVITTATYAARALGAGSGMGLMKAAKLAPDAILLPVDFDAYRHYSRLFKAAVATLAPAIEDRGIDEIYIDLRSMDGSSLELAQRIKAAVRTATELSCSIGIAPNKLLAKICSDLDKPDGITILAAEDMQQRIWPLPARKINGIGPKAAARLETLGISTIGELADTAPEVLQQHFGLSYARWLLAAAHGMDERPVVTHGETKSVSRETTFERDLHAVRDKLELGAIFTRLCEQVAADLQRKGYVGKTIGIKLRFDDFKSVTRDLTLDHYIADAAAIRLAAGQALKRAPLHRRLRLLGVRVGHLLGREAFERNKGLAPVDSAQAATNSVANDPFTGQLF